MYDKGLAWVKKPRESTFRFSVESLIDTIDIYTDGRRTYKSGPWSFYC